MSQTTMSDKMEVTRSDDEVYGLLAAANLLRTRKQTELALNKCMEVLRRQPDNASAHSLLGDICRDQGRLHEAAEWYKLALQYDPSNIADRDKLDALLDVLYARPGTERPQVAPPAAPELEPMAPPLRGRRVPVWMMIAVITLLMMVLWVVVSSMEHHGGSAAATRPMTTPVAPPSVPSRATNTTIGLPSPALPESGAVTATASPAAPAPVAMTPLLERVDALRNRLREVIRAQVPQCDLLSVTMDDSRSQADVALALRATFPQPNATKQAVLTAALAAARTVAQQESKLARIQVQVSGPLSGQTQDTVLFIGEAEATRVAAAPTAPSPAQVQALFSQYSWHRPLDQAGL